MGLFGKSISIFTRLCVSFHGVLFAFEHYKCNEQNTTFNIKLNNYNIYYIINIIIMPSQPCVHGKRKSYCTICGGSQICVHNKQKHRCIDCKGSAICMHNKIKYGCKQCKGSALCQHNINKQHCKECGNGHCEHGEQKHRCIDCGTGICEHNKIKYNCVECEGSSTCAHKKSRQHCKECSPHNFCIHNKYKNNCKECGTAYCEHNRWKSYCIDCGSGYCEHNIGKQKCRICSPHNFCSHDRDKHNCRDCGTGLCEHNRMKNACVDCGTAYCEHGTWKSHCFECGGGSICKHNKRKTRCKQCGGSELCKSEHCESQARNDKYNGYCLRCCVYLHPEIEVSRNYKTKETDVVNRIVPSFPHLSFTSDKRVQDGCSRRRPDLLTDMGTHIIIIEIDENKHDGYDCSCENKRLMEISQDVGHRPIVFIRFNPDGYSDINGINIESCWKYNKIGTCCVPTNKIKEWNNRIDCLNKQIQYWIDNKPEKIIEIVELFY